MRRAGEGIPARNNADDAATSKPKHRNGGTNKQQTERGQPEQTENTHQKHKPRRPARRALPLAAVLDLGHARRAQKKERDARRQIPGDARSEQPHARPNFFFLFVRWLCGLFFFVSRIAKKRETHAKHTTQRADSVRRAPKGLKKLQKSFFVSSVVDFYQFEGIGPRRLHARARGESHHRTPREKMGRAAAITCASEREKPGRNRHRTSHEPYSAAKEWARGFCVDMESRDTTTRTQAGRNSSQNFPGTNTARRQSVRAASLCGDMEAARHEHRPGRVRHRTPRRDIQRGERACARVWSGVWNATTRHEHRPAKFVTEPPQRDQRARRRRLRAARLRVVIYNTQTKGRR